MTLMRLTVLSALLACGGGETEPKPPAAAEVVKTAAPPKAEISNAAKVFGAGIAAATVTDAERPLLDLGRALYFDPRLSKDDTISCNSCHQLDRFGVDGEPTSPGIGGKRGGRNSPTSLNAFGHLAQFWDGRAPDVEAQAKGPVLNPGEMAMPSEAAVEKKLSGIQGYVDLFAKAFPGETKPITYDNMAKAIGAFERKLSTPSKLDRYLGGQTDALTAEEVKGMETFVATGCTACHSGPLLGGQSYMKLGMVEPYETNDLGRYEVTKNEADKYVFKVPSLRNVAKTGPYFHDGSVATLEDAVTKMAKHQLGKTLSDADRTSIVTFLGALTGEVDAAYTAKPTLP
jgi:cytochrome c peroxidase